MKARLRRNLLLFVAAAVILALAVALLCVSVSAKSASADEFTQDSTVTVAHITDTHYYAFRLTYVDGEPRLTADDDYYYNYVMEKCTKLWMESELVFDAAIRGIAEAAKADIDSAPDYLVLSGDCAQDGELLGHIDVANKLRKLQNYIRNLGKPGFQIFAVMGNHDLYNPESWRFDNATGTQTAFFYTTRIDAVRIYAGLGYPNMTDAEAATFYGPLITDGLIPEGYTFVRSDLSASFEYRWEFVKDDNEGHARTFRFGTGEGQYSADEVTMAQLLAADQVKVFNNYSAIKDQGYGAQELDETDDIAIGQMSTLAARITGDFSVLALDVIQSNAIDGHVLGGQLQFSTWDWLDREENRSFVKPNAETVVISVTHHSVLPHWDQEEEITTGFIMYNWQEVSDFLADYGVRYAYTGHQHANDATSHVSNNGNQIIDMESAANVSVGSQVKWTTIKRGHVGGKYAEIAILDAYQNETIPANETVNTAFIEVDGRKVYDCTLGLGNVQLFEKVFKNDKYGYVAANQMNTSGTGPYINYETKEIVNYSQYAQHRVYENIVDNYLNAFLRPEITQKLGDLVAGIVIPVGSGVSLDEYAEDVVTLANNLIKGINEKVLADYTYTGPHARLQGDDMKLFGFAEDLVLRVLNTAVAADTNILSTFLYAYMGHSIGSTEQVFEDLPDNYQAVLKEVESGAFVDMLFDTLLDENTGLMRIINGLCNNKFDLSEGVSDGFKDVVSLLMTFVVGDAYGKDYDFLANFDLGDFLRVAANQPMGQELLKKVPMEIDLVNMTVPEIIGDIVDKYLTDNFKQAIGEYAYNIVVDLGVNAGRTDVRAAEHNVVLKVYPDEQYTYIAKERAEVVTVENGKLPGMITNVFGSDPATTRNFTYFTDRRIDKGAIQYTTDAAKAEANVTTKATTTERYAMTKGLIDLGIWCQAGYYEASRHTVELTGLTGNTTYYFRLGEPDKGYWTEWYSFKTAKSDGFEVLIASDLQASTESSYQRIDKIYRAVLQNQFANGIDFLINPGDVVDNSRNATQFKWFLNSSADIYAQNATVVVAGNHDNKYFDLSKAKNLEYYARDIKYDAKGKPVSVENVVTDNYNYLWSHYDYALGEGQAQPTGFYYSFDYAGVHFVMLNTNDIVNNCLGQAQYTWLINDLKASQAKYKVVVMHKSLYSEGSHSYDQDVVGLREQLTPKFSECGVNLVIAGHDHTYNETFYLDGSGKKINTDANGSNEISTEGTLYVTMGTMGEKFYNYKDNSNVPTQTGAYLHDNGKLSDPTFGKLVMSDGKLYYYGYQYVREMSEDGYSDVLGGEIKAIIKGEYKEGLTPGAIAGIVVGSVGGAAIITAVVLLILKKKGILFAAKAAK